MLIKGDKIVGIFDHLNNESSIVEVYNDQLKCCAKREFKTKLELWLIDNTQVVLKSIDNHEYMFYTHTLELKFTLNLSRVIIESGYRHSVILAGFSVNEFEIIV